MLQFSRRKTEFTDTGGRIVEFPELAKIQEELAASVNRVVVPVQAADRLIDAVEETLAPLAGSLKNFAVEDNTAFRVPNDKEEWKLLAYAKDGAVLVYARRGRDEDLRRIREQEFDVRVAASARLTGFAWRVHRYLEQVAKEIEVARTEAVPPQKRIEKVA